MPGHHFDYPMVSVPRVGEEVETPSTGRYVVMAVSYVFTMRGYMSVVRLEPIDGGNTE